jgi:hypothetical protein
MIQKADIFILAIYQTIRVRQSLQSKMVMKNSITVSTDPKNPIKSKRPPQCPVASGRLPAAIRRKAAWYIPLARA